MTQNTSSAAIEIGENSFKTCQWLGGEPKERSFCGEPVQHGSSYCPYHHKRCYLPMEKKKGKAA